MGALLATLASVMYGLSNVLSGEAVRRHPTAALALWAQSTGLIVVSLLALYRKPDMTLMGVAWGLLAGAVGALSVLAFYTALQRGRTSIVASVAGTGVVVPVLAGILSGDSFGWRVGLGVCAAIAGVIVVAAASGDEPSSGADQPLRARSGLIWPACRYLGRSQPIPADDACVPFVRVKHSRGAIPLAVASAIGFGGYFVVVKLATLQAVAGVSIDNAFGVALSVQMGALAVTAAAATRHSWSCLRPRRIVLLAAMAIGLLDVLGDLVLTVSLGQAPLTVVGPLGSLAPVVAVLIATVVLQERIRPLQALGIGGALTGIIALAIT